MLRKAVYDGNTIEIKYDPMGNRILRKVTNGGSSVEKKYIVDISGRLPTILCEIVIDDPCSLENSYVYADGRILKQYQHTETADLPFYYINDRLGSVRLVVDDSA